MTDIEDHGEITGVLAIICTDQGRHKRTRLCSARFYADGYWTMSVPNTSLAFLPPLEGANSQYIFDCPRCPRTPQFSREKWVEAMNGRLSPKVDGDFHAEFDVSLVPFQSR